MRPDRLSELGTGSLGDLVKQLGDNETLTVEISTKHGIKGLKMSRHRNVTFWQAFVAMTWFPVLAAIVSVYVWKSDQSSVFVHYVRQNLAITITGLFGAWVVATIVVIYLFRFIRRS